MMKFTLTCLTALSLSLGATAQTWITAYTPATATTGAYSLASTVNGNVYAYKANSMVMSNAAVSAGAWMPVTTPSVTGTANIYAFKNTLFLLDKSGTGSHGLMRSLDFGATWQSANSGFISSDSERLQSMQQISANTLVTYHVGAGSVRKIYVSDDNGASWYGSLNMMSQTGINIVTKGSTQYLSTTGTIYESTDDGNSWNNLSITLPAAGGGRLFLMADGSFVYAAGAGGFYTAATAAFSFTAVTTTGLPVAAVPVVVVKSPASDTLFMSTAIYATSTYGVYYSADKGATWAAYDSGLPTNAQINNNVNPTLNIAYDGYLYTSDESGAKVYRTSSPVTASRVSTTGITDKTKSNIAMQLAPNPAMQSISISFPMQQQAVAGITVTNATGVVVLTKTINATAGSNQTQLDIAALAAGSYFVTVQAGNATATQQFVKQ